jgi:acyl-CoA thioesterase-1
MKNLTKTITFLFFFFVSISSFSQDHHVRFAFMGNSITIGSFLENASQDCYPSQVQLLLDEIYGDTCIVENFANSGRTMLKKGDFPLWNEIQFSQSMNFAPDIVFILLGTNDSKPYNWDDYGVEFLDDYQSMIDTFKVRNPRCRFIVSYPPPAFSGEYDIRDSVIFNGVLPAVDAILANNEAEFIDFYYPLQNSSDLFPDGIHPDEEGARIMAQMVVDKIVESDIIHKVETGYTFVTNILTSSKLIANGSEVTLNWETRNADSVYFDDVLVENNESITVNPSETTTYTVRAVGAKSSDVMQFEQAVYSPVLNEMKTDPRSAKINTNDNVLITVAFIDQERNPIANETFDLSWRIIQGEGELTDQSGNTIVFVASTESDTKIEVSSEGVTAESRFIVSNRTSVNDTDLNNTFSLYPNPVNDVLYFTNSQKKPFTYQLINSAGEIVKKGIVAENKIGMGSISSGVYFLEITVDNQTMVKKLIKN